MNTNNTEIERKFLIDGALFERDQEQHKYVCKKIVQGYWKHDHLPSFFQTTLDVLKSHLSSDDYETLKQGGPDQFELRIRQSNTDYLATFKGRENLPTGGIWEYEYPLNENFAQSLLIQCDFLIEKRRFLVPLLHDLMLEVDVFDRLGLVLGEIEIPSLDTPLPTLPAWVGDEVTGKNQYMNRSLAEEHVQAKRSLKF